MGGFDINQIIMQIILVVPGFLLGITVHEYTHGYVAYKLGDPTAKLAGRLTFNPISHLDPIGAIFLIIARIGWAKPVPVDPRYLRNPRQDMLWISLGGPAANMVTAVVLAVIVHGIVLAFRGRPMDQMTSFFVNPLYLIFRFGVNINIMLAVFNLLPVPPLDGAKILEGLLPRDMAYQYSKLEPYGFIIILILFITGVTSYLIWPPIMFIERLLLGGMG